MRRAETLNLYKAREGEGEVVLEAVPNGESAGRVDTGSIPHSVPGKPFGGEYGG